jgi:hypothetical protein
VLNLSKSVFATNLINLSELESCPIRLSIHSIKKIRQLEKAAKNDPHQLPPLEIAILPNNKKYIIKRHSVFEALKRAGINEFKANFHTVKSLTDVVILHARMSQSSPINPLSILDLRDYLIKDGFNVANIASICCLDPSYEKLLSCVLSPDAKNQLLRFLDLLSQKLSRVVIPSYVIEIISKKSQDIQTKIIKTVINAITDDAILNDRDFVFPNPEQIRIYTDFYKNPQERNTVLFERVDYEENSLSDIQNNRKQNSTHISIDKKKEIDSILGNVPHMALMDLGNKKYRLDWKNKTFAEINERENNEFIIIRDSFQLQKLYALSSDQLKFLRLSDEEPYFKTITCAKQLCDFAQRVKETRGFRCILIFNKKF